MKAFFKLSLVAFGLLFMATVNAQEPTNRTIKPVKKETVPHTRSNPSQKKRATTTTRKQAVTKQKISVQPAKNQLIK
jgi:uncharacterized membrane protein